MSGSHASFRGCSRQLVMVDALLTKPEEVGFEHMCDRDEVLDFAGDHQC